MTTYKLPDWLGGGEVVVVPHPTDAPPPLVGGEPGVLVAFPGTTHRMMVPYSWLTKVTPSLPPEPPNGTVYSNEADAWIRCDDPDETDPEGRWYVTGMEDYERWPYVAKQIAMHPNRWHRYIPDPADDAPELPLKLHDGPSGEWLATVSHSAAAAGHVFMEVESTDYDPATARGIAAAIWRAAREVEEFRVDAEQVRH